MEMDDSALARVENKRIELEANIAKLRKSLRHWQTLEIDYEGLKEEFLGIPEDSSIDDCLQAALDFKADLVDEKELRSLLRDNHSRPRRPSQLVDLLSKRVDYVSKNVEIVRKQLSDAEKKRNALLLAEEPDHRDDAGLPLAEITEELDESGNIISSKVQNPGSDTPQLINVLKKAGVEDLEEIKGTITNASAANHNPVIPTVGLSDATSHQKSSEVDVRSSALTNPNDTDEEALLRRDMLDYRNGLDEVGAIVAELDLEEQASDISYDEDDDNFDIDAELEDEDDDYDESEDETGKSRERLHLSRNYRKQMEELQSKLGLQNVGPQAGADESGLASQELNRPPAAEAARKAAIARQTKAAKSSLKSTSNAPKAEDQPEDRPKKDRKKVAFSSELDIAQEGSNSKKSLPVQPIQKVVDKAPVTRPIIESIIESIIERTVDSEDANPETPAAPAPAPARQSRFRSTRQPRQPQLEPYSKSSATETDGDHHSEPKEPKPPPTIVSTDLVERPAPNTTTAPDPNDFSVDSHRQEIAMEYQRLRIKRIHAQEGGFLGDGEDDNYGDMITPIQADGEDGGKAKKISRFKAARLKQ